MPRTWFAAAALLLCGIVDVGRAQPQSPAGHVIVTELDGIIQPVTAEYFTDAINEADTSGAELVVLVLRTPGGLLDSTRDMVSRMITSRAPIVVFVGPSGARAASAGFILLMAADVAVMAPATHAGAAHPVSGSGEKMDDTTSQKAASDAAAYVRSLAEARGRNVGLAGEAVLQSRAFTDREALDAMPPLIDFSAKDLDDLLRQLDGRTIKRFDGRSTTLQTRGAEVRRIEMTRRQRFLSAIAHPQVSYILMTLGLLGLTVELWNPGLIAPGVVGAVCLLLAFFAFQILPVSMVGLLLVVLGLALLLLELKVPSFGALGIGGAISLVMGSVMLTDVVPGVRVGLGIIVPTAIGFAVVFLFLGRLALRAQRQPSVTGVQALVGHLARVRTPLLPNEPGLVDLRGEIWRAISLVPLPPGHPVRVSRVDGLTLTVEPADLTALKGAD
ncbi:MAG TPA: nodulation protein NfeD [Vicinamibacterales bacterium]|nr:nodulation protein NfeD [Vicinamibacterales bacterium]